MGSRSTHAASYLAKNQNANAYKSMERALLLHSAKSILSRLHYVLYFRKLSHSRPLLVWLVSANGDNYRLTQLCIHNNLHNGADNQSSGLLGSFFQRFLEHFRHDYHHFVLGGHSDKHDFDLQLRPADDNHQVVQNIETSLLLQGKSNS